MTEDSTTDRMATGFFMTPFSPEGAGNEDPSIFQQVLEAVNEGASKAGVDLRRADDIFAAGIVINQIRGAIEQADVVVAICTGRNANVFYELGLAEVLGHKPVLVAATSKDLPFDVQHWRAQLYSGSQSVSTLAERVQRAIRETLEGRRADVPSAVAAVAQSTPDVSGTSVADNPQNRVAVESTSGRAHGPLALSLPVRTVRDDDYIGFNERVKDLIRSLADQHTQVALANETVQPSISALEELKPIRWEGVKALLDWVMPAIEYKPDWLGKVVDVVVPWFDIAATRVTSGFTFWNKLHEGWVTLFLRSAIAHALDVSAWNSVQSLVLSSVGTRASGEPLTISPAFTWPSGYLGDGQAAFDDFLHFLASGGRAGTVIDRAELPDDATRLACGADMALGLARCLYEAKVGALSQGERQPVFYAAFATFYCNRINWLAHRFDTQDVAARSIGAMDAEHLRQVATERWPDLIKQHHPRRINMTCPTWNAAASSEGR